MINGVLVDLYGTLVHEGHDIVESISEKLAKQTGDATAFEISTYWSSVFSCLWDTANYDNFQYQLDLEISAMADVLSTYQIPLSAEEAVAPLLEFLERPPLFPDAKLLLEKLAPSTPVCIVSNVDRYCLEVVLEHHGLSFEHSVTSDDVRCYKPEAAIFDAGLKLLNIAPHEVLHVGDSLARDIGGAQPLGIQTAWLNRQGQPMTGQAIPDHEVTSLSQVARLM